MYTACWRFSPGRLYVTASCPAGKPAAAGRAQTFPDLHTALEEYSRTGDMSVLQGLSNFMGSPDQVCPIS